MILYNLELRFSMINLLLFLMMPAKVAHWRFETYFRPRCSVVFHMASSSFRVLPAVGIAMSTERHLVQTLSIDALSQNVIYDCRGGPGSMTRIAILFQDHNYTLTCTQMLRSELNDVSKVNRNESKQESADLVGQDRY